MIGGGHNGLTCAAYLARGGMRVLVVEARDTVGGCASTEEALGGARVNICNCDHSLIRATGVIEDLDLAAHGLEYLELDPGQVMVPWDGSPPWALCNDVERTLQSLSMTYPREVANYRRHIDELRPVADLVLAMTAGAPEFGAVARRLARLRGRGLKGLMRISRMSCTAVLREYFNDEALLAAPATTGPSVWGLDPSLPGTGLGALGYVLRHVMPVGRPVGGSGRLTDALGSALQAAGGEILTGRRVTQIRTAAGATAGVTLDDGRQIDAPTVVAAGNPHEALAHLLQVDQGPGARLARRWGGAPGRERVREQARRDRRRAPTAATAHRRAPRSARALASARIDLRHQPDTHADCGGGRCREGRADRHAAADARQRAVRHGRLPAPPTAGTCSASRCSSRLRPPGGWEGSAEPERWLRAFSNLVQPSFFDGIRRWRLVGPREYERDFSMPRGHAPSFSGGRSAP